MAVDWAALTIQLSKRLEAKYVAGLTWTQVATAVNALSPAEKDGIVLAIQEGKPLTVGNLVVRTVGMAMTALAHAEASAMLSDQALSPAELDRLFGQ